MAGIRSTPVSGLLAPLFFLLQQSAPSARSPGGAEKPDRITPSRAWDRCGVHHTSFTGKVVDGTGAPISGVRVVVVEEVPASLGGLRATAEQHTRADGTFRMDDVNSLFPLSLDLRIPGARAQIFNLGDAPGETVDLGEIHLDAAVAPGLREPPLEAVVRVLAPNGGAVEGAQVSYVGRLDLFAGTGQQSSAHTDARGHARIWSLGAPDWVYAQFADDMLIVPATEAIEKGIEWKGAQCVRLDLIGAPQESLQFEFSSLRNPAIRHRTQRGLAYWRELEGGFVILSGAGRVPRLLSAESAVLREGSPKGVLCMPIDMTHDIPWALQIQSGGKPVPGALIDLVAALEGAGPWPGPEEVLLATLVADSEGWVRALGPPEGSVSAVIYAEGHEPRRWIWRADLEEIVPIRARSAEVIFDGLGVTERLLLKRRGTESRVPTRRFLATGERRAKLTPMRYDALVVDDAGTPARGCSFVVSGAGVQRVDLGRDRRARRLLTLPEPKEEQRWLVRADRAPSPLWSQGERRPLHSANAARTQGAATVEWASEKAAEIVFHGTGRFVVEVTGAAGTAVYSRWVDVHPGTLESLELPELSSALALDQSLARGGGGVPSLANPRLLLHSDVSRDGAHGWDITVPFMASAAASSTWLIDRLPAGPYFLDERTREPAGNCPATFGGGPIRLIPNQISPWREDRPVGALCVLVFDASGGLCRDGTLRIRDGLGEAWRSYAALPDGERLVSKPLLRPPSFGLRGEPLWIPCVRAGRLHLEVELRNGMRYEWTREVDPRQGLMVRIR
ncbi:MAG: hypothetical protein JNJ88_11290 [Planctomycetes bacterium]|nr:hypothetical protein [Planctomycetota bacterium]